MRVAEPNQTVAELLSMLDEPGGQTILIKDETRFGVLVSSAQYQRFRAFETSEFDRAWKNLSDSAAANGLTEEELDQILTEIDAETPR